MQNLSDAHHVDLPSRRDWIRSKAPLKFVKTRDLTRDFAEYGTHALVPQFDFGSRWAFDAFLLGLGARVGLSVPVSTFANPIGPSGCRRVDSCDPYQDLMFVAGVFLDLGWYL
jgi:hypothetical protein